MTNFLGGCHHLRIEVGRWRRVPGPARVCRLCGSDSEVEDELHVLFTCPFFQDQRDELLLSVIRGNEGHTVVGDELLDFLRKEKSWEVNLGLCKFISHIMNVVSSAHREDPEFRSAAGVFTL